MTSAYPPDVDMICICARCGVAVEDQDIHDRFHADIGTMADSVLKVLDTVGQRNRLTFARGLTLQRGIPAA